MSRGSKKDRQLIMSKALDIMDAAKNAASTAAQTETVKGLEDLVNRYDTVHLKAYKKNPQSGKFALFVELPGQRVEDLKMIGLDSICQDQGGAGDYEVMLKTSDGREFWFKNIFVGGTVSHQHSKLQRETGMAPQFAGQYPGGLGGLPMAGYGGGYPQQVGPQAFNVDLMQYMNRGLNVAEQAKSEHVQMLQMQMQQQRWEAQQQQDRDARKAEADRQFMMLLLGNQNQQQQQPNAEIMALRAEIERMRSQQSQDAKLDELKRQLDAQNHQMMLETIKASSNSENSKADTLLQFMMMMQQNTQAAAQTNLQLMEKMMDRPGEDERINSLLGTMAGVAQNQLGMVSQIAQMGLLGGGDDHTVRDAVLSGLEGLTQIAVAAMQARAAARQQQPPPQMMPPPTIQAPPAQVQQMPPPAGPMGGLPPAQDEPSPLLDQPEPLTADELEKIGRDKALAKVIAMIQNGDPVNEISARIMNHARSENQIAIRWLQYPYQIGYQAMAHFDIPRNRAEEVAENIVEFLHFLNNDGDPDEWTAGTGYQLKKPPRKVVSAASLEGPELGSSTVQPTQGVEYSPTEGPAPDPNALAAQRNAGVTVHEAGTPPPPRPSAAPDANAVAAAQNAGVTVIDDGAPADAPTGDPMEELKRRGPSALNAGVQEMEIPDDPNAGRPAQ